MFKRLAMSITLAVALLTGKPIIAAELTVPTKPLVAQPADTVLEDGFTYLADYAYAEVINKKPAEIVRSSLKDVPEGRVVDEIYRAADAFGIQRIFMVAIARIESDFDPKNQTGSYIGLYQLSHHEFDKYGEGKITDARDNAIAAAVKFTTESARFKLATHKKATAADLYMVHQQGLAGAIEHFTHPDRLAWRSMCATDEGKANGEKWCKRAIWDNTLPEYKKRYGSVDNFTSGEFIAMWHERVNQFMTTPDA